MDDIIPPSIEGGEQSTESLTVSGKLSYLNGTGKDGEDIRVIIYNNQSFTPYSAESSRTVDHGIFTAKFTELNKLPKGIHTISAQPISAGYSNLRVAFYFII